MVVLDLLQRPLSGYRVAGCTDPLTAEVHQQAEELPVVGRRLEGVDAVQPGEDPLLRQVGKRVPVVLRDRGHGVPDGGHLNHPLLGAGLAGTPVLGVVRVGAVGEPLTPAVPVVEFAAPGDERHAAVERPGVAL